jgi:hypothetical protein
MKKIFHMSFSISHLSFVTMVLTDGPKKKLFVSLEPLMGWGWARDV